MSQKGKREMREKEREREREREEYEGPSHQSASAVSYHPSIYLYT